MKIDEKYYNMNNFNRIFKKYFCNKNHRVRYITNPEGLTEEIKYASCCNQISEVIHSNGARTVYTYDLAERIQDVYNLKPNNELIKSFHYQRDVNGFVVGVVRENSIWDQYYIYDNRLQLQGVIYGDGKTEVYTYDGRGNRLSIEENGQIKEEYQYNIADEINYRQVNGETESYNYSYQDSNDYLMVFTKHKPAYTPTNYEEEEYQYFDYREKMVRYHKKVLIGTAPGSYDFEDTMDVEFSYLPDGLGRVGKKAYRYVRLELGRHTITMKEDKDIFYLNDFYDLLYEKEEKTNWRGAGEPEYFQYEKYYTMGPGIDFPLVMSYSDTDMPYGASYFYFLSGHNDVVFFADENFTEDQIETYEYNPWGVLLTEANKNNLLYTSREFDFDTGLYQYNQFYNVSLAIYSYKDELIYKIFSNKFLLTKNLLPFEIVTNIKLMELKEKFFIVSSLKTKCCIACWIVHEILDLHCLDCLCCLGTCGFQCYECEW